MAVSHTLGAAKFLLLHNKSQGWGVGEPKNTDRGFWGCYPT